jgi:fatty aldehyde-generating acyl-ACP reductase
MSFLPGPAVPIPEDLIVMFGLIGHSTSLDAARSEAASLGYPEYAEGDFEMWCVAPPQLVETVTVTSPPGH